MTAHTAAIILIAASCCAPFVALLILALEIPRAPLRNDWESSGDVRYRNHRRDPITGLPAYDASLDSLPATREGYAVKADLMWRAAQETLDVAQ
jgi:hypothetical protein